MSLSTIFALAFLVGYAPSPNEYFTITYENKSIKITDNTLSVSWWNEGSKQDFTRGRSLTERAREAINSKNAHATLREQFPELYKIVQKIDRETYKPKNDGRVKFDPDREEKFWIVGQKSGRELDKEKLCREILHAIATHDEGGQAQTIRAKLIELMPPPPEKLLKKITLRSQYSTTFVDNAPRENNIALALEAFDGLVVERGEKVSFNDIVGRRTRGNGYQDAKIIIDGEFVDGVGGGVCQASTTIFNAVLLSGLKILESHNHSIPIGYVPLGLDAMVSSVADLEFQNNTGETLYIEARVIDNGPRNRAVVKIYGPASDVKYKTRTEVSEGIQKEEVRGEMPLVEGGLCSITGNVWHMERVILEKGFPPRTAHTYLDTYRNGQLVGTQLIRKSRYKGKERIITYEKKEDIVAEAS